MFRGINIETGEWVYGYYFKASGASFILPEYSPLSGFYGKEWVDGFIKIHPNSIAQNIGKKDKNGNDIYSSIVMDGEMSEGGDVVEWEEYWDEDEIETLSSKVVYTDDCQFYPKGCVNNRFWHVCEIIGTQWKGSE